MKTMIEIGDTRLLCDRDPQQICNLFYAGAKLVPLQSVIMQSTLAGTTFCKTYRVERNNYSLGVILTEVPT
jgi:hypothetical protein